MTRRRPLVLDTNVLLRAVFGISSRAFIQMYSGSVAFCIPDICVAEGLKSIPPVAARKRVDVQKRLEMFEEVLRMLEVIELRSYAEYETAARRRISARDPNDWPILATALLLDCPLWTEDQDFFGTGVATWTTNNVEIYLDNA